MCSLWFSLIKNTHLLYQNNIYLPCIALIWSLCHCEGVNWWKGPNQCRWWSWTWTPLRQRLVCFPGIVHLKNFKRLHFKSCGVIIVLVSIICVYPYLLYFIKWLDVLGNIFVSDGTDGWAGVQEDPVQLNTISCWCLLCALGHGEAHLYWLCSSAGVGCWWWEISHIIYRLLSYIVCSFWKGSPIISWCCLIFSLSSLWINVTAVGGVCTWCGGAVLL